MTPPRLRQCRRCGADFTHPERAKRYCSDDCKLRAKQDAAARQNARNKRLSDAVKLSAGCSTCGYNKSARALHWHHKDPALKTLMIRGTSHLKTGRIAEERDAKCVLLCANCHYELHDTTINPR